MGNHNVDIRNSGSTNLHPDDRVFWTRDGSVRAQ